jgi:hypothetical protein
MYSNPAESKKIQKLSSSRKGKDLREREDGYYTVTYFTNYPLDSFMIGILNVHVMKSHKP